MHSLGQKIRDLRQKMGLTQIELSKGICTPSMISQIESDRARPSYKILYALADRLEVPLEHLLKDIDLGLEHTSTYKMAQGLVRSKEYKVAIPLLEELLLSDSHNISKIKLHLETAFCYLELGHPTEAIPHLTHVYEWAFVRNDQELLILSQLYLGTASRKNHDLPIALYHTNKAFEELTKTEHLDPSLKAKVLVQLASLHEDTGNLAKAIPLYEEALLLHQMNSADRGRVLLQLADAHHRRKNFDKSDEFATKASLLLEEQNDVDLHQEWKHHLIMLKRNKHNGEHSVQELLQLAKRYEENGDSTKTGQVFADVALIYLENDELDEAWLYAKKAKLKLPTHHPAMGKVFRILAYMCFKREEIEKGQAHLENAIAIFTKNDQLGELEEVTLSLCHSLTDQEKHREAFERLERFHQQLIKKLEQRGITLFLGMPRLPWGRAGDAER